MRYVRPDFDATDHRYTNPATGAEFASVTRILKDLRLYSDWSWADKKYRQRGEAVHMACLEICKGEYLSAVQRNFHEEIRPYAAAFAAHLSKSGFRPDLDWCEVCLADAALGYAGTPDFILIRQDGKKVLWDVKTGYPVPLVGMQLAAYGCLLEGFGVKLDHRVELNIKDGRCTEAEYSEPHWRNRWNAAITVFNTAKEYNCF